MARQIVVDIAQLRLSDDPEVELVTYSLGSCIGVAIWDPVVRVGGLLHFMLPRSTIAPDKARVSPGMFADTGVPLLFKSVYAMGGIKGRLVVKIAGAAALFKTLLDLDVGRHNLVALRRLFWRNHILIDGEHVSGNISRTMRLRIGTGEVTVENHVLGRLGI